MLFENHTQPLKQVQDAISALSKTRVLFETKSVNNTLIFYMFKNKKMPLYTRKSVQLVNKLCSQQACQHVCSNAVILSSCTKFVCVTAC